MPPSLCTMRRTLCSKPDGSFALILQMPYEAGMSAAINAAFIASLTEFTLLLMLPRDSLDVEPAHSNPDSMVGEWRV